MDLVLVEWNNKSAVSFKLYPHSSEKESGLGANFLLVLEQQGLFGCRLSLLSAFSLWTLADLWLTVALFVCACSWWPLSNQRRATQWLARAWWTAGVNKGSCFQPINLNLCWRETWRNVGRVGLNLAAAFGKTSTGWSGTSYVKNPPPLALSELLIVITVWEGGGKKRKFWSRWPPEGVHPFLISHVTAGTKVFAIARRRWNSRS